MFRNNLIGAVAMALAGSSAAVAATGKPMSPGEAATAAQRDAHALDTERYLQTELDWRSYYLNRLGAPRDGARPDMHVAPQPRLRNGG